jgi:hypothetical protein
MDSSKRSYPSPLERLGEVVGNILQSWVKLESINFGLPSPRSLHLVFCAFISAALILFAGICFQIGKKKTAAPGEFITPEQQAITLAECLTYPINLYPNLFTVSFTLSRSIPEPEILTVSFCLSGFHIGNSFHGFQVSLNCTFAMGAGHSGYFHCNISCCIHMHNFKNDFYLK